MHSYSFEEIARLLDLIPLCFLARVRPVAMPLFPQQLDADSRFFALEDGSSECPHQRLDVGEDDGCERRLDADRCQYLALPGVHAG